MEVEVVQKVLLFVVFLNLLPGFLGVALALAVETTDKEGEENGLSVADELKDKAKKKLKGQKCHHVDVPGLGGSLLESVEDGPACCLETVILLLHKLQIYHDKEGHSHKVDKVDEAASQKEALVLYCIETSLFQVCQLH